MLSFMGLRGQIDSAHAMKDAGEGISGGFFQCVSPRCVFGPLHLQAAYEHLERRRKSLTMRTKDYGMEFLLSLSATDQIDTALERCGLRAGEDAIVVVWSGSVAPDDMAKRLGLPRDDSLLGSKGKDPSVLGIDKRPQGDIQLWAVEMVNLAQL